MLGGLAAALCAALAPAARFVDPLDVPARPSALAPRSPLNSVAAAGARLVAVGQRGHVLLSDDRGASWSQAAVPVSTDLTAVRFVSPERGWAAGHDGVILATSDGGRTWTRQLDARGLGPDASFLDVWFADERTGLAVGAFGLVVRTRDGGRTWTPCRDLVENPRALHLHAIARAAGELWIAGEQGLLLRHDAGSGRFRRVRVPYVGSFFGVVGAGSAAVAYGLRGNAWRTEDGGETWRKIETGADVTLVGAATLPDGRVALVAQSGRVVVSDDGGRSFRAVPARRAPPAAAAVASGPDALAVVGPAGARLERLR